MRVLILAFIIINISQCHHNEDKLSGTVDYNLTIENKNILIPKQLCSSFEWELVDPMMHKRTDNDKVYKKH